MRIVQAGRWGVGCSCSRRGCGGATAIPNQRTDTRATHVPSQPGYVTTLAGTAGAGGSTDATGTAARFNFSGGVAIDTAGNAYVADNY